MGRGASIIADLDAPGLETLVCHGQPIPHPAPVPTGAADGEPVAHDGLAVANSSGRKLSVSSPAARAIEPEDSASGVGRTLEPIRRMTMTPLEPRKAGSLKGFGFTVRWDDLP